MVLAHEIRLHDFYDFFWNYEMTSKNVAGAIAKQAVNIGKTYINPEIAIAHNAIGCKQRKKNSPEEKVVDLSDYKNRNNRKRLIHKRK